MVLGVVKRCLLSLQKRPGSSGSFLTRVRLLRVPRADYILAAKTVTMRLRNGMNANNCNHDDDLKQEQELYRPYKMGSSTPHLFRRWEYRSYKIRPSGYIHR
jgi:hypothetical protein